MMNGHPAMMNVSEERTTKSPPAITCVLEVMIVTVPAVRAHQDAGGVERPGIDRFPSVRGSWKDRMEYCNRVQGLQVTSSAIVDVHLGVADRDAARSARQGDPRWNPA